MSTYDEAPDAVRPGCGRGRTRSTWCCLSGCPWSNFTQMLEAAAPAASPGATKAPQGRRFVAALQSEHRGNSSFSAVL